MSSEAPSRQAPRALVFRLGGWVLASAGSDGGRVVEIESLTRVPTGPACLLGLANAQGTVLSVIDIRPLLGLRPEAWEWPLRAQVVGGEAMRVAFALEQILGFDAYRPERLEALGADVPDGLRSFARGWVSLPPARAVLLDVPRIVEALRYRTS